MRIDLSAERALMRGEEEEEVISLLFYSRVPVPVRACVRAKIYCVDAARGKSVF